MVEITEEPDEEPVIPSKTEPEISVEKPSEIAEDSDSDLEQFYDALESKIDEDEKPVEVLWENFMKNLDVKIEKANHAKLKGTEFFKMGNLAQAESHYLDALQYLPNKVSFLPKKYKSNNNQDLVEKRQKQLKDENSDEIVDEPAAEVRAILHGNLSAVQKRDNRLPEAIEVRFELRVFRKCLEQMFFSSNSKDRAQLGSGL